MLLKRALFPPQVADPILAVAAVVGGVVKDGVVELAAFFEMSDEPPDRTVRVVDCAVVYSGGIVESTVLGYNFVWGGNDGVGFVKPKVEEEGLIGVAVGLP